MKIFSHDLITDFKKALCGGEKSPRTVEKYLRDVSAFFAWAGSAELFFRPKDCQAFFLPPKNFYTIGILIPFYST